MKKKEIEELKNKQVAELETIIGDSKRQLHALSLDLYAGKVKNVRTISELRKKIARAYTFITQQKSK
jgi:ribosomal protein L29